MKNIDKFCENIVFGEDEFGKFGIKTFAVLKAFSESTKKHASQIGNGFFDMKKLNYLWVTMRMKFKIARQPKPNEVLKLVTYPCKKNLFEYHRDFLIFDSQDNIVLKGTSKWCLIDAKERHIVRLVDEMTPTVANVEPLFEDNFYKTDTFEPEFLADYSYNITADDIDLNRHANNTVYAKMIDRVLKHEKRNISFFQINFLRECLLNDRVDVFSKRQETGLDILGKICEGENSFSVHIDFE